MEDGNAVAAEGAAGAAWKSGTRAARAVYGLLLAVLWLGGSWGRASDFSELRNLRVNISGEDRFTVLANLTVERVFTEQRRLGFFRVRLLPTVVAQGVRLELQPSLWAARTNWSRNRRLKPGSLLGSAPGEWRDFSVWVAGEAAPRLRAARLRTLGAEGAWSGSLEEATLETEAGTRKVAKATLLLDGPSGRVSWEEGGRKKEWDLYAGSLVAETPHHSKQE